MDDIKVSIITICRNSAQDISKTLRSVLNCLKQNFYI